MHKIFGKKEDVPYLNREGAYIIPMKNNKIAVVKTPKGYFLLGGGINKGETYERAIERECLEEIGYTVKIGAKIGSAELYTKHPTIGYFHPIQAYYLGELLDKIAEPVESDHELMWVDADELRGNMFSQMQSWAIDEAISATR